MKYTPTRRGKRDQNRRRSSASRRTHASLAWSSASLLLLLTLAFVIGAPLTTIGARSRLRRRRRFACCALTDGSECRLCCASFIHRKLRSGAQLLARFPQVLEGERKANKLASVSSPLQGLAHLAEDHRVRHCVRNAIEGVVYAVARSRAREKGPEGSDGVNQVSRPTAS